MQVCKSHTVISSFILAALVTAGGNASAQSSSGSSGRDSLWDLSMPSIAAPSLGTGFYRPGIRQTTTATANSESAEQTGAKTATPSKDNSRVAATASQIAKSVASSLSADDVQALGSRGLLNNFSSLLAAKGTDGSEETNKLLNKVLEKMEEIKAQDKSSSSAVRVADSRPGSSPEQSAASTQASTNPATSEQQKHSRLLRFAVNGYNVLRTCRTVYISDVQTDGTFLVTGDRRYMSDGKARNETFHMLFKTKSEDGGQETYSAATAVTQDSYNPNSFLYQLSERKNMTASRTGNLVSMRTEDPSWKLELLIDLAE